MLSLRTECLCIFVFAVFICELVVVTSSTGSETCPDFDDLRIVHPGTTAALPTPASFAVILVEFVLTQRHTDELLDQLPTALENKFQNPCGTIELFVDGQEWGTVPLLPTADEAANTGADVEADATCKGDGTHVTSSERAQAENARDEALRQFQLADFGSDEAIRLFSQWTSLSDSLAKHAASSCSQNAELGGMARQRAFRSSDETKRRKTIFVADDTPVRVYQRRVAHVWAEPGMAAAERKLWVALEVQGVGSGNHLLQLRVRRDGEGGAHAEGVLEDGVEVRVMTEEEAASLPAASASLLLEAEDHGGAEEERERDDGGKTDRGGTARQGRVGDDGRDDAGDDGRDGRDGAGEVLGRVTLCVLSGFPTAARETVMNSLRSWGEAGLLHAARETVLFMQELMPSDHVAIPREVAAFFPDLPPPRLRLLGADANIGIGRAAWELVQAAGTDLVIFLEDDWILPYGEPKWRPLLEGAAGLLDAGRADVVRLKSDELSPQMEGGGAELGGGYQYVLNCGRFAPPDAPHFFCACLDHSMARPEEWGGGPEEVFHDVELCHRAAPTWDGAQLPELRVYCMPSRVCKYTNTPTLFSRAWFLRHVGPTAFVDPGIRFSKHFLEETVNVSWPLRPFVVGVPDSGLFGHVELDDKSPGGPLPTFH